MRIKRKVCRAPGCSRPARSAHLCVHHYKIKYRKAHQVELNAYDREYYRKNKCKIAARKKTYYQVYRHTRVGLAACIYNDALARVSGRRERSALSPRYTGLPIMEREEFIQFILSHPNFEHLFKQWAAHGYNRMWRPSPDRKQSTGGYTADNLDLVPLRVNLANASMVRRLGQKKQIYEMISRPLAVRRSSSRQRLPRSVGARRNVTAIAGNAQSRSRRSRHGT